ncbi:MAG: hypothetical protein WC976_08395 [Caldisericia bacterium]
MNTTKSRFRSITATFLSILLAVVLMATGCAPKVTGMVDVPVGDDMATQIKKGTTIYATANVPAFVLDGAGTSTTDFFATVKVLNVLDTRTIRVEILSPTAFEQQQGNMGYLYLCQPLLSKAEKLPDGTVVYSGGGYPQVIAGQEYNIGGILQNPWQDYPYVYIPTAVEFRQSSADSTDTQMFITAAKYFAVQAEAAGDHHLTAEPVVTVSSKQVQSGKMSVVMYINTLNAMNSGDPDTKPMIAGELQYLRDYGAALSAAARKAVEDDIADWRNTIESAMNTPTETNYLIKVVVDVDQAGTVDASTLQVYVDDGAVGIHLTPAAEFLKGMRSAWVTVAQAYANAESIAAAAKAP